MDDPAAAPGPSPTTDFRLLGPLMVSVDGSPVRLGGPRQVAVLARLVLSPGLVVSMDELVDSVWDGDSPSRPDAAVRSYVSNLRRGIEPDRDRGDRRSCIESAPPGYRLVVDPDQLDVNRFEGLLASGRAALAAGQPAVAAVDLAAAKRLWRGDVCEGAVESDALLAYRLRMADLRLTATELLSEARLHLGEHEAVIADLEPAIAANPLRERLTELAMVALYRAGRQSDALSACRELHRRLLDELGLSPGVRIQDLEHRILIQDPELMPEREAGGAVAAVGRESEPAPSASDAIIGRDDELDLLDAARASLPGAGSASVLVTGEPGSGKTTLVATHCARHADGIAVWGRCREVAGSQPLWPWGQVVDGVVSALGPALGAGLDELAALSPLLRAEGASWRAQLPDSAADLSDGAARLFQPVVELLRRAAAETPVTVVFDDAHWADGDTLELVSYAVPALVDQPVLFVVVWRDTEPGGVGAGLRALAGLPRTTRIELGPLSAHAVDTLVERAVGGGRDLARLLYAETAGNARFVHELVRSVGQRDEVETFGAEWPKPSLLAPTAGLRDGVMHRIEQVHPLAAPVLAVGGLHRNGFTAPIVAETLEESVSTVEDVLEHLVAARLLRDDGPDAEAFRFVHPIVASAVLDGLSGPRRARLHAAVGHAMWRAGWPALELAYQFSLARSAGTTLLAARFAVDAARRPIALDEIRLLEGIVTSALGALASIEGSDQLQAELAAFLAQVARVGDRRSAFEAMATRALSAAERAGDPELVLTITMAATGPSLGSPAFCRAVPFGLDIDRDPGNRATVVSRLREAGSDGPPGEALRARLTRSGPPPDVEPPAVDGVRSRRSRAPSEPPPTLDVSPPVVGVGVAAELARSRLDLGRGTDWCTLAADLEAALDAVDEPGHDHDEILVDRLRLAAAVEAGDRTGFETIVGDTRSAVAPPDRAWTMVDLDRCSLAIAGLVVSGDLVAAEELLDLARPRCHRAGVSPLGFDRQLLVVRLEQGKGYEVDELLDAIGGPDDAERAVIRAVAASDRGDLAEAARWVDEAVTAPGWDDALDDRRPLGVVALAAPVVGRLADRSLAKQLAKVLVPRRRTIASLWAGTIMVGPTSYYAGLALLAAGKRRPGREQLDAAEQIARELGARTWLARILAAQADVSAADGDRDAATARRREAGAIAEAIGVRSCGAG